MPWRSNENDIRCVFLKRRLEKEIVKAIKKDHTHFITGMALGVDTYAAQILLNLKNKYHITVEAAVPCRSQPDKWNAADRARYSELLAGCDIVTVLSEEYTPDCMYKRNQYMVDNSDMLVAVYDGKGGGTGQTVKYAESLGKEMVILKP